MPFAFLMTDYLNRLEEGDPNAVRFHNQIMGFWRRIGNWFVGAWNWTLSWFR
jgi:hypothetical protein